MVHVIVAVSLPVFICYLGGSALFQVTDDKFQGGFDETRRVERRRTFYQTLGYANIIMKIDYCFYRVKPTAVIMCLYFPFTLLLCCDWS